MKQIIIIPLLLMFLIPFVTAIFTSFNSNVWDEGWGTSIDLSNCRTCALDEYDQYFTVSRGTGENVFKNVRTFVQHDVYVENLTGTDHIWIVCIRNALEYVALPNPQDMTTNTSLGSWSVINASNFESLPAISELGLKRVYSFGLWLNYPASVATASGGDEIQCRTQINWVNETNAFRSDIGAVDKISIFDHYYYPDVAISQGTTLFDQFKTITGFAVNLIGLNYQVMVILYWVFLIGMVVFAIFAVFSVPVYIYRFVKKLLQERS